MVKEKRFKNVIKPLAWSHILWWMELKLFKEFFYRDFLHRQSLCPFFAGLFGLFLWRVDRVGKVVFIRYPEAALEIIKSTDIGGIANEKPGKDGMKVVLFGDSSLPRIGSDLEFYGEEDRAEHVRGKPWGAGSKSE